MNGAAPAGLRRRFSRPRSGVVSMRMSATPQRFRMASRTCSSYLPQSASRSRVRGCRTRSWSGRSAPRRICRRHVLNCPCDELIVIASTRNATYVEHVFCSSVRVAFSSAWNSADRWARLGSVSGTPLAANSLTVSIICLVQTRYQNVPMSWVTLGVALELVDPIQPTLRSSRIAPALA